MLHAAYLLQTCVQIYKTKALSSENLAVIPETCKKMTTLRDSEIV